jgi:ABC-2 type transport system permease protein
VFRISLRLQRTGLLGMTAFGVIYGAIQSAAYQTAAGTSAASRVAFGHQMEALGPTFSWFLPLPVRVDTVGGFLQWRVYGALPLLFGFWALMSAAGATRGDEERGLVEQWLTRGAARTRYLTVRVLTFCLAAVVSISLTSAAIYLGAAGTGSSLDSTAFAEISLALLGLTLLCYTIAMALAQLVSTRNSAAGLGGAVLLVLFLLNGFSRTVDSLRPLARAVSPFYYYDRSNPLTPGGSFDLAVTLGLFAVAAAVAAVAIWLMTLRDIGSPIIRLRLREAPHTTLPSHNPLFRVPVLSVLYERRVAVAAWSLGTAFMAVLMASIAKQMGQLVSQPGAFHAYLTVAGHGDPLVAITGYFWIGIFEFLLAIYAITQVARWSADDNEGRLEMQLTAPVSRWRVVTERFGSLALGTLGVIAVSSLAFYLSARASGIGLKGGDVLAASLVMLPFALTFGAVGAVLAGWVPRATVAILSTLAFLSYLITQLGPLLRWPDWALNLSVFSLLGNPLTDGVKWSGLSILIAVTVVGFGLAAVVMQRREVGS